MLVVLTLSACTGESALDGAAPGASDTSTTTSPNPSVHRVAVALDLSGATVSNPRQVVSWIADSLNDAGGEGGRPIELVWFDLATVPLADAVGEIAADPSIRAVVGPNSSAATYAAAEALLTAGKVIVAPMATSADLTRAFGASPGFFRTVQSDIGQLQALLELAAQDGARSVSLLTSVDHYGATFFDWFAFEVGEHDLAVGEIARWDHQSQGCESMVDGALQAADVTIAVPSDTPTALCIAQRWRALGSPGRLLFADGGESSALIDALGPDAEGLEGTSLAEDPTSGFAEAFQARFSEPPTPYAANLADAVSLVAYGLAAAPDDGGDLARELGEVLAANRSSDRSVNGREPWSTDMVAINASAIANGERPVLTGATGALHYLAGGHGELSSSFYRHWTITDGRFVAQDVIETGVELVDDAVNSVHRTHTAASRPGRAHVATGQDPPLPARTGLRAVLVAASSGWDNYRHQADVLAVYRQLRSTGVSDDDIVLVLAGGLVDDPANPTPGELRNVAGGPNLAAGVVVDYDLSQVTSSDLAAIIAGHAGETASEVSGGPGDDLLVFVAGHGDTDGVHLGLDQPVPVNDNIDAIVSPSVLDAALDEARGAGRMRRALVVIEACMSGVFASGVDVADVVVLTSAGSDENSHSTNYDPVGGTWLADEFSVGFARLLAEPSHTIDGAHERLYLEVPGSHVTAGGRASEPLDSIALTDFSAP